MAHKMLAVPVACDLSFVVQTYDLIFLGRSFLSNLTVLLHCWTVVVAIFLAVQGFWFYWWWAMMWRHF